MIYLYVKTHKVTGLKYFGKTTQSDPYSYRGSGTYWKRHLKKHGYDVDTEIIGQYDSITECEEVALKFSIENNIVESNDWANLKAENGQEGNPKGIKFSTEHREKIRQNMLGKCYNDFDEITRKKMSIAAKIRADNSVINGTCNFSGEAGSKLASERNKRQVAEHRHIFQGEAGSIRTTNMNNERIKNGTHSLLKRADGSSVSSDRVNNGTHSLLKRADGSSVSSDRVNNGTHHFLKNTGTVPVIDKNGNFIRVKREIYWAQEGEKCDWEFVGTSSKEAKLRLNKTMNTFSEAVKNGMTFTENGMLSPVSSNSACVDFFYKISASRGQDIIPAFTAAFVENKDIALRIVLHARDIRQGSGERQIFRNILQHLERINENVACALMNKVEELGRWDDLFINHTSAKCQNHAFTLVKNALMAGNGLSFKWTPRLKSAKSRIANEFRVFLGMSPKEYRKFLVAGTNVTENSMCQNKWDEINFSQVPSVCHARNKKSFGRHTEKYGEYVQALVKGDDPTVSIKASAIFPHDVLKGKISTYSFFDESPLEYNETELAVIEQQWKALPNYIGNSNILPLVDVSGSMCCSISGSTTALDIAVSLGLYCSDKNTGIFKDMFLTFSGEPELLLLKGNIIQKINQMVTSQWAMNTDLNKAFAKILKTAIEGKVPQEEMPKVMLILSDMQIDSTGYNETAFEMIARQYNAAEYTLPQIVFWNLLNRDNVPVKFDTNGTALVSGYSPSVLKAILKNDMEEFTPENIMLQTVCVPRYNY